MTKLFLSGGLAAVAAIIAVASGWYFFVREDASLATEPPEIPSSVSGVDDSATPTGTTATETDAAATTAAATDAPAATDATYTIISDLSEAAYFAHEELASLGLPSTAKGSTTAITGTITLAADGSSLDASGSSQFTVDLTTLASDESRRDNRVQQALETGSFPTATFKIMSVTGYDPAIADGQQQNLQLTGTLDLHGVQKDVTWNVEAVKEGDAISALATLNFLYSDFNIAAPNIAGFVSVADDVTLQVQLVAEIA